jgi:outer membrane protein assembly factor BamB
MKEVDLPSTDSPVLATRAEPLLIRTYGANEACPGSISDPVVKGPLSRHGRMEINVRYQPFRRCSLRGQFARAVTWIVLFSSLGRLYAAGDSGLRIPNDREAVWGDIGLQTAWVRQSAADGHRSTLSTITPFLTAATPRQIFEVYAPDLVGWFTPESLDRYGSPLGESGAQRQADILQRTLAAEGAKAEIRTRLVSRMMIYLQTDSGILQCIDAETGMVLHNLSLGSARSVSDGIGANESKIAAVHGSKVSIINLNDEKVEVQYPLPGVPAGGLLLTEDTLLVPLQRSRMASFRLDNSQRLPGIRNYGGGFVATPVRVGERVISLTNSGQLYVEDAGSGKGLFRVDMRSRVAPGLAHNRQGMVFAASQDGFIFAVDPQKGSVLWQRMVDGTLRQAPLAIEKQMFACSVQGKLFCLSAETGDTSWAFAGAQELVGVNDSHVFCTTPSNDLIAIDRTDGALKGTAPLLSWRPLFTNGISDRIFLTNSTCQVRALRPIGRPWPTYYVDPWKPVAAKEKAETKKPEPPTPPSPSEEPVEEKPLEETPPSPEAPAVEEEDNPFTESNAAEGEENPF